MNAAERETFVRELAANVLADVVAKVPKMPDDWNGIELRQYLADKFAEGVIKGTMQPSRRRAYNNTVLVRNL